MELIYIEIYSFILTEKFHGDIGRSLTFAPEDETNISLNSWYVSFCFYYIYRDNNRDKRELEFFFLSFCLYKIEDFSKISLFYQLAYARWFLLSRLAYARLAYLSHLFRFFYSLYMYIFLYPMLALIGCPGSRKHYGNPGRRKSYAVLSRASFKDSVSMKRDESTFFSIW